MARLPTTLRLLPSSMLSSLCGFEAGGKSRCYEHIWVDGVLLFRCGLVTLMMDMISEILSTGNMVSKCDVVLKHDPVAIL
jgi:hypothetical protein